MVNKLKSNCNNDDDDDHTIVTITLRVNDIDRCVWCVHVCEDAAELFRRGHRILVATANAVSDRELAGCDFTVDYTTDGSLLPDDVSLRSSTEETSFSSDLSVSSSTSPDTPVYELQ